MTAATPSRLGQVEAAGAVDALWLKVFAGEVLTFAASETVYIPRTFTRTISQGKSA